MGGNVKPPSGSTPFDADGLRRPELRSLPKLFAAEAENILFAQRKHLKRRRSSKSPWLTEALIRRVHRDMFDAVWNWAGKFRTTELTLGVPAYRIAEELKKLCDDRLFWDRRGDMPVVERAVRLHARLAWIHPFRNGNGRHARLITDMYLHSHGQPLPQWPHSELLNEGDPRADYLAAMRAADTGDVGPLIKFTRRYLSS